MPKPPPTSREAASAPRRPLPPSAVIAGLFLLIGLACLALDTFSPFEQRIAGVDPVGYYAWIRSLAFDGDLQFENEYRTLAIGDLPGDELVDPDGPRTATGHLQNAFSIGPGLLWAPFLLVAHVAAWLGPAPADGFSQPYHAAVYLANTVYALAGLLLTYAALRKWFDRFTSALGAFAAWGASPMLYYAYAQEAMSHAASFFTVALFLCAWSRLRDKPGYAPWLAVGAALGLAALARWQNVTFALVPAVDLLARDPQRNFPKLAACGAATVVAFLPQMLAWKVLYGSFLTIPQGGGFMDWTHPHFIRFLFSAQYGLITWTPLTVLGIAGLFLWPRENRLPFVALALAFLVQLYVQAVAGNVGWSFGMRRTDNLVPLFAVGYALLLARFPLRPRYAVAVVAAFVFWNFLFALQYGGFLDAFYVQRALDAYAQAHGTSAEFLLQTGRQPDGRPFDLRAFGMQYVFPKEAAPTFAQFTTDKFHVLIQILLRML